MSVVVVVVTCASCAGYSLFKSLFVKLFISKRFFWWINSFPALQYGFTIFLAVILSDLIKLSLSFKTKHNCKVNKYSHVDIDVCCSKRGL